MFFKLKAILIIIIFCSQNTFNLIYFHLRFFLCPCIVSETSSTPSSAETKQVSGRLNLWACPPRSQWLVIKATNLETFFLHRLSSALKRLTSHAVQILFVAIPVRLSTKSRVGWSEMQHAVCGLRAVYLHSTYQEAGECYYPLSLICLPFNSLVCH